MALSLTKGVGNVTIKKLIGRYFSAENIFSVSYEELIEEGGLSPKQAAEIRDRSAFRAAEAEMAQCKKYDITPIALVDQEYPTPLRHIHDAPHILYVQGDVSLLTRNLISMIGTRSADAYGLLASEKIVESIAKKIYNPVIVSGLAFGIDSYCHGAALANNVPTIAVLPCSLPNIMPPAHAALAANILKKGGALISDMHSAQGGAGKSYISRNRIIAGMSLGTILVESGYEGGAMTTMELVDRMDRVAMAVPGRMTDYYSVGCNMLINQGKAVSVTSANDIVRALGWEYRTIESRVEVDETKLEPRAVSGGKSAGEEASSGVVATTPIGEVIDPATLSSDQLSMLSSMLTSDPIHISALAKMNPMPMSRLNSLLIEMELLGLIKSHAGALYQRAVVMEGRGRD